MIGAERDFFESRLLGSLIRRFALDIYIRGLHTALLASVRRSPAITQALRSTNKEKDTQEQTPHKLVQLGNKPSTQLKK